MNKIEEEMNELKASWFTNTYNQSWQAGGAGPTYYIAADGESAQLFTANAEGVVSRLPDKFLLATLVRDYCPGSTKKAQALLDLIKADLLLKHAIQTQDIKAIGFKEERELVWNRLPFTRADALATLPSDPRLSGFKHILSLTSVAEARSLVLWIGSLLDYNSSRIQYLHLKSDGGNGKSTLFESLARAIGKDCIVSADKSLLQSEFFGEQLEGKRLVIFPDENSSTFFSSGKFKRLTGEEGMTVNPKFKAPRYVSFTHKTVVLSNHDVEITNSDADSRRLVSITLGADSETGGHRSWYNSLLANGQTILAYCYGEYVRAVEADASIRSAVPVDKNSIREAVNRKYEDILEVFYSAYEFDPDRNARLKRSEVNKYLSDELLVPKSYMKVKSFVEALQSIGIEVVNHGNILYYTNIKKAGRGLVAVRSVE
jgi:hypothetical protein